MMICLQAGQEKVMKDEKLIDEYAALVTSVLFGLMALLGTFDPGV